MASFPRPGNFGSSWASWPSGARMGLVSSTDMAATEIKYQCRWGVSRIQTGREYIHRVSEILLSARSQLFLCIYIGDPANIFSSASRVTACLVLRITSTMPRLREIHCSDSIDLYWPVIGQNARHPIDDFQVFDSGARTIDFQAPDSDQGLTRVRT